MTAQEGGQVGPTDELDEPRPGVAQHHDEDVQPVGLARLIDIAHLGQVDLRLLTQSHFAAHDDLRSPRGSDR